MPTVSIITPCYNAERYIAATIRSVRAQTFSDWELIVVDDGSTDRSAAIVAGEAARDDRIRLVRQPNGGLCAARNAGFAKTSPNSRYLLFLDADDCLAEQMLARTVSYLDARPHVGMVFCAFTLIDAHGSSTTDSAITALRRHTPRLLGVSPMPDDEYDTPFITLYLNWCGALASGSLLRRSAFEQTRGWDESFFDGAEDTDLFLQIALTSAVHRLPEPLLQYRRHPIQASRDGAKMHRGQEQLYRKWSRPAHLEAEHRRIVRRAWAFREGQLLPYSWLRWGVSHVRRGRFREGIACSCRAVRQLLRYALLAAVPPAGDDPTHPGDRERRADRRVSHTA